MYAASHLIPEENVEPLAARIEKLNRRIDRAKVDSAPIEVTQTDQTVSVPHVHRDAFGRKITTTYSHFRWVTIIGETPKLAGWSFVARYDFERAVDGSTVCHSHSAPGEEIPAEFVEVESPHCDHCHSDRFRRNTFLVRNDETGEHMVVGRSCLKDFLGHVSPERLASLFEIIRTLGESDELSDRMPGVHYEQYVLLPELLAWSMSVANERGFISKRVVEQAYDEDWNRVPETTSATVSWLLSDPRGVPAKLREKHRQDVEHYQPTDENYAEAGQVIEMIENAADDNDYVGKLKRLVRQGQVSTRNHAIAVSAVTMLLRERKRAAEAEAREKAAEQAEPVVEGRVEIAGSVVSTKLVHHDFGATLKMLVVDDRGFRVWGTAPGSLSDELDRGSRVRFVATVTRSSDDEKFGFFKRPAKAELITEGEAA